MHTGMLWFDNDPEVGLAFEIQKAADHNRRKYGRRPDLCLVHPNMLERHQTRLELAGLTVRGYRPVLPGHLWLGVEDED